MAENNDIRDLVHAGLAASSAFSRVPESGATLKGSSNDRGGHAARVVSGSEVPTSDDRGGHAARVLSGSDILSPEDRGGHAARIS